MLPRSRRKWTSHHRSRKLAGPELPVIPTEVVNDFLGRVLRFGVWVARSTVVLAILAGVLVAAGYVGYQVYLQHADRKIRVCAVTDFSFREENPSWEYRLTLWFAEVNRIFQPSGIRWDVNIDKGRGLRPITGTLDEQKADMDEQVSCQADVVLGFSGSTGSGPPAVVSPFGHSALISARPEVTDALMVSRVSLALARLFGAATGTNAVVSVEAGRDEVLDRPTLKLASNLRRYDFANGVGALPGRWEDRARRSLAEYFRSKLSDAAAEAEANRTLGRAYMDAQKHEQAVAQLRRAVELLPKDGLLRFELGLELNNGSMNEEALQQLREAARLSPEDARPHAAMGGILVNQGRYDDAVDELRIATRLDSHESSYQALLGRALSQQLGGARDAAEAFEAALRSERNNESAAVELANLRTPSSLAVEQARQAEQAVREHPNSSQAHLQLGLALIQSDKMDAGRREIERAIALDAKNGVAHLALARLEYRAGNHAAALAESERARAAGAVVPATFIETVRRKLK